MLHWTRGDSDSKVTCDTIGMKSYLAVAFHRQCNSKHPKGPYIALSVSSANLKDLSMQDEERIV